jgi:hypothetical protein
MRTKPSTLGIACLALLAAPVLAVDGVREINQVCADTTGCFAGDAAGMPVTITLPGSYRLTGSLLRPSVNTHGVVISASDVTLDLNGFQIVGTTSCSGVPVSCASPGTGRGVTVTADSVSGVLVRNGSVRGSGEAGVYLGRASRVEDVRVASSGGDGIRIADFSRVLRCEVTDSGVRGIRTLAHALVEDNLVAGTGAGISGIEAFGSAPVIRDNKVTNAGGDGIHTSEASISGNIVSGCVGDAVEVSGGARIAGNTLVLNVGFGIRFGFVGNLYTGNTIYTNSGGALAGPVNVSPGDNSCDGAAC